MTGVLIALAVAIPIAWIWLNQEKLLFFPEPLPAGYRLANDPDVVEFEVPVDGARLSVLHLRLPRPKGVVFYLHGNAGNLSGWFSNADFYREANYDLVMPDYRGYGKSTGRIRSEDQLLSDVRAVWDEVAPRYAGGKVVIYGRSLGTAPAAELSSQLSAAGRPADLTVLVTPYTSVRELASEIYPVVPQFMVRYPLETASRAQGIRGPILLYHGDRDELIPLRHSERLRAALPNTQLLVVAGARHNDIHEFPAYRQHFLDALRSL
ncbi:alpha/beta fold hydrolase [Ramlibacter solisilvae]|uniref:alpha/beta hydrolase n=1 Tax=Ramlibacter tataouinensis TaxID=94132 RepID=UPI0007773D5E|nr:alpha/beta fold hydrolase [Ramlibacter tataouinensis]